MFYWPLVQLDKNFVTAQLAAKYPSLARLGPLTNIIATDSSSYDAFSRMTMLRLVGSNNQSEMIRAEDLRLAIDPAGRKLRSTICQVSVIGPNFGFFSGRGFGHGVGMCQYGSEAMARSGSTGEQILAYYYPGSVITRLY
jgi:stage II sporulation protein D